MFLWGRIQGMDKSELEKALSDLPLGPIRYYEHIGSTNSEAAQWIDAGAPELALVVADEQTAGRGRQGRTWYTPPEASLAFSLVLKDLHHSHIRDISNQALNARYTGLGALAVSRALKSGYQLPAEIKWPNDVLLFGQKVAGVLVEASWQGDLLHSMIVGIGVNIKPAAVPPDSDLIFPATCVETALGKAVSRVGLLHIILEQLLNWRKRIIDPEFLNTWEQNLAFKKEWVQINSLAGANAQSNFQGQVLGLNADGRLRLRLNSGEIISVSSGEIRMSPIHV